MVDLALPGSPRKQRLAGGFATKAAAVNAMNRLQSAVVDGTHVERSRRTLGAYLEDWLAARNDIRANTARDYGVYPTLAQCDFFLTVKQLSDCQVSPENQGVTQHGAQNHGVVHNHAGGTFYFVVDSYGSWTFSVTGAGRGWGIGPANYCSEG
jgi:hypothetical protein